MAIIVSAQDVADAEDFLETFVSDEIEEGDYTDGALLRDLAIKAIAYIFAYLQQVDTQIRARQSLKTVEEVDTSDDEEAADDAVDEILSNWFATRKVGEYARVVAYGYATDRVDIDIPATTKFYKTSSLAFILDNEGDAYQVAAEELVPQFDSSGEIAGYFFRIPLVSEAVGTGYNIDPGNFATFDDFSSYVTQVMTLEKAQGGDDVESTEDFIERSETLITVRNLINARSADAVLRDKFDSIRTVTTIGMGDDEMARDLVEEAVTLLRMHVGGHQDMFVDMPTVETAYTGVVGAKFTRPDGVINVFRDKTYADYDADSNPTGRKFTDAHPVTSKVIQAGMVLRIVDGLVQLPGIPDIARDYIIREVRDTELLVSERVPFPIATDENSPVTYVTWSVGVYRPNYLDVIPQTTTGETSKQIQNPGRIALPGKPLYAIKSVTIEDSSDADADPADGLVYFNNRVNQTPVQQVAPENEFQVVVHNPTSHQSAKSYAELIVGTSTSPGKYDGKTCKVTFDTLAGFSAVDLFVSKRNQRISGANPLTRAFHPIYLRFSLEYRLKKTTEDTIDNEAAVRALLAYINTFDPSEVIGVSTISDFFHTTYPQAGHVYPFEIDYLVHVPDGRVVEFTTSEDVIVPYDSELLAAMQTGTADVDLLTDPLQFGLGDDVMRYLALESGIEVKERV
jgi:hypothetical protein